MDGMELLEEYAGDILNNENFLRQKDFIQHGSTTVYDHCVSVAIESVRLARRYKNIDYRSLVRGALLHDFFLYDWHVKDKAHRFHGFIHAGRALKNACKEFSLSPIERDIIKKHMFPLNPIPYRYKESFIVGCADKICSFREMTKKRVPVGR